MGTSRRSRNLALLGLPLSLPLWLAGCATTDQKAPETAAVERWTYQVERVEGPAIELEHATPSFELARVEHDLALQHRRPHALGPVEERWVLRVRLSGPTAADAEAIAEAVPEVVAVMPGGRVLSLPYAGRTSDHRAEYVGVLEPDADPAEGPVAFRIQRTQVRVPAR